MDTDPPSSEAHPPPEAHPPSEGVGVPPSDGSSTSSNMPSSEGVSSSEVVAPFAGFTSEDTLGSNPPMSSEVPEKPIKRRGRPGRPRKVASEGEDRRRDQMNVKKWTRVKDASTSQMKVKKWTRVKGASTTPKTSASSELYNRFERRLPSDLVNTSKLFLPEGWKCLAVRRSSGVNKGLYDLIYITPNGKRMRSRRDIYHWTVAYKSDLDPCQFLFSRAPDVLYEEENASKIIFRDAAPKGQKKRTDVDELVPGLQNKKKNQFNTVISDEGKELLLDDESSSSYPQSISESKEVTPKKKQSVKPRRVPLEETLECLKSPYFSLKNQIPTQPVSIHAIHNPKWIPPRSPYNLIQEDLYHNPWQLLIATIFLNCTAGKLAIPVIHEFLARWPSPHEACSASLFDIVDVIQLLGLGRSRAATIIRFSHEFLTVDWKKPTDLFGIGKYGHDSYKVFCLGQWRSVESEDRYLNLYINWLHNACGKQGYASRHSTGSTALLPI